MQISCEVCNKEFKTKRHLKLHYARNHVDKAEWSDVCEICGKVYADSEILKRHIATHQDSPVIQCEKANCVKQFTSLSAYNKHTQQSHDTTTKKKKPYQCSVEGCEASFTKHHLLTQHSYVHTGIPPFNCATCERSFLTQKHRNRHMKVHNGYQCSQCNKNMPTWTDLRSHIAINHPRVYKCSECDKVFHMACRLKEHKSVHSDDRQVFKCRQCDRTFVKKHNLKAHVKVVHLKQRKFKCGHQNCEKTFAYKHSLKKHMHIHQDGYVPPKKRIPTGRKKVGLVSRITGLDPNQKLLSVLS